MTSEFKAHLQGIERIFDLLKAKESEVWQARHELARELATTKQKLDSMTASYAEASDNLLMFKGQLDSALTLNEALKAKSEGLLASATSEAEVRKLLQETITELRSRISSMERSYAERLAEHATATADAQLQCRQLSNKQRSLETELTDTALALAIYKEDLKGKDARIKQLEGKLAEAERACVSATSELQKYKDTPATMLHVTGYDSFGRPVQFHALTEDDKQYLAPGAKFVMAALSDVQEKKS